MTAKPKTPKREPKKPHRQAARPIRKPRGGKPLNVAHICDFPLEPGNSTFISVSHAWYNPSTNQYEIYYERVDANTVSRMNALAKAQDHAGARIGRIENQLVQINDRFSVAERSTTVIANRLAVVESQSPAGTSDLAERLVSLERQTDALAKLLERRPITLRGDIADRLAQLETAVNRPLPGVAPATAASIMKADLANAEAALRHEREINKGNSDQIYDLQNRLSQMDANRRSAESELGTMTAKFHNAVALKDATRKELDDTCALLKDAANQRDAVRDQLTRRAQHHDALARETRQASETARGERDRAIALSKSLDAQLAAVRAERDRAFADRRSTEAAYQVVAEERDRLIADHAVREAPAEPDA